MKRFYIIFVSLIFIISIGFLILPKNKIKVAEVTHGVFYVPFYVALEKGYFEDEDISIDLILTPGADKVTAAVMPGDVQVGLCGSEATVYI